MTRMQRLIAWLTQAVTLPERQCERLLLDAMRRAGWTPVRKLRVCRRKR